MQGIHNDSLRFWMTGTLTGLSAISPKLLHRCREYAPLGLPFIVALGGFEGAKQLRALWFNPRSGEESVFAILPARGRTAVVPPTQGKGHDWVLILEAVK